MTNEQLIAKFNPANGANLTAEDMEILRGLTDKEIDILADAYPNKPTRRSYLRLYDTSLQPNKQLYQLSTWQNLRNVRKFSSKKNLVPYDFASTPASLSRQQAAARPSKPKASAANKVLVDLSATEAAAELTKTLSGNITAKPKEEKPSATKPQAKGAAKGKTETPKEQGDIPEDQQTAVI